MRQTELPLRSFEHICTGETELGTEALYTLFVECQADEFPSGAQVPAKRFLSAMRVPPHDRAENCFVGEIVHSVDFG